MVHTELVVRLEEEGVWWTGPSGSSSTPLIEADSLAMSFLCWWARMRKGCLLFALSFQLAGCVNVSVRMLSALSPTSQVNFSVECDHCVWYSEARRQ